MTSIEDFELLNPSLLGIDENFLNSELYKDEAEEVYDLTKTYENIISTPENDWYKRITETLELIINSVNTKILYLIYR